MYEEKTPYKNSYFLAKQITLDIACNEKTIKLPIHEDIGSDEFLNKVFAY